jgi:hypothetical protein
MGFLINGLEGEVTIRIFSDASLGIIRVRL